MADAKTKPTKVRIADFIASVPDASKRADAEALVALFRKLTGQPGKMWGPSIVGFGTYHYRYDSGREGDSPIIGFSPRKSALVVYIVSGFEREAEFLARLGKHTTGKSCLYVKRLADIDLTVLEALATRSIAYVRAKYPATSMTR